MSPILFTTTTSLEYVILVNNTNYLYSSPLPNTPRLIHTDIDITNTTTKFDFKNTNTNQRCNNINKDHNPQYIDTGDGDGKTKRISNN